MSIRGEYEQSEHGNFKVIDTIGVPHPYMIGPKHVTHAADHFGGLLSKEAIEDGEKRGIHCAQWGCKLSYEKHETALLIGCLQEIKGENNKVNPELHAYLLKIKDECEKNGYAGFAFQKGF